MKGISLRGEMRAWRGWLPVGGESRGVRIEEGCEGDRTLLCTVYSFYPCGLP